MNNFSHFTMKQFFLIILLFIAIEISVASQFIEYDDLEDSGEYIEDDEMEIESRQLMGPRKRRRKLKQYQGKKCIVILLKRVCNSQ